MGPELAQAGTLLRCAPQQLHPLACPLASAKTHPCPLMARDFLPHPSPGWPLLLASHGSRNPACWKAFRPRGRPLPVQEAPQLSGGPTQSQPEAEGECSLTVVTSATQSPGDLSGPVPGALGPGLPGASLGSGLLGRNKQFPLSGTKDAGQGGGGCLLRDDPARAPGEGGEEGLGQQSPLFPSQKRPPCPATRSVLHPCASTQATPGTGPSLYTAGEEGGKEPEVTPVLIPALRQETGPKSGGEDIPSFRSQVSDGRGRGLCLGAPF